MKFSAAQLDDIRARNPVNKVAGDWVSLRAQRQGETMRAEITLHAIPQGMVHLVAGNLGQIIGVQRVEAMEGRVTHLAA